MLSIRLSSLKCIAFCWLRTHFVPRMFQLPWYIPSYNHGIYLICSVIYLFILHVIYILKKALYII